MTPASSYTDAGRSPILLPLHRLTEADIERIRAMWSELHVGSRERVLVLDADTPLQWLTLPPEE